MSRNCRIRVRLSFILVLTEDVDNAELKQRLIDYQNEIKSFKEKIKEIDKKSKKREQDFKKQQAYLVALEQKLRKSHAEEREL
jgi:septal ring factor EnvC (AmiA/AmiB activator)